MPAPTIFQSTFASLRGILATHAKKLVVQADGPDNYQLASRTMKDRAKRPLFVAAVQIKKSYVSYHLLPLYMCPELVKEVSPELRKRMQGKACFNFKEIEPAQAKELARLTRVGIAKLETIKLPWV
jgi:hypothetical protein